MRLLSFSYIKAYFMHLFSSCVCFSFTGYTIRYFVCMQVVTYFCILYKGFHSMPTNMGCVCLPNCFCTITYYVVKVTLTFVKTQIEYQIHTQFVICI